MSAKIIILEITDELSGLRLDKALATIPELNSRSRAAQLIDDGLVRRGQKKFKASHKTTVGEIFEIELPKPRPAGLVPYDFPLHIYFEDADVIVINKPAGLVMHPSAGHESDTLVNALLNHTRNLAVGFHEERPGIVHRLDKETSGVLVVAKNDFSLNALALQFRQRTVHRIYFALVHGGLRNSSGTVISHLRRHPTDRKRFASEKILPGQAPRGKRAVTHYTRLAAHPSGVSLVRCQLETGRTHQIRVHLSEMGHPIVGDKLYGSRRALGRIALHAAELGFTHPRTGEKMSFSAPWPEDLLPLLKTLGWT